jgi:hypothetical protein
MVLYGITRDILSIEQEEEEEEARLGSVVTPAGSMMGQWFCVCVCADPVLEKGWLGRLILR